jgi:CRP-like cAMP-binding protein
MVIRSKHAITSSEIIRDINKRVVLNLIRTLQPISRADLARACGLQRSTVSLIVEQLIEEQWVVEGPPAVCRVAAAPFSCGSATPAS